MWGDHPQFALALTRTGTAVLGSRSECGRSETAPAVGNFEVHRLTSSSALFLMARTECESHFFAGPRGNIQFGTGD